jgi:protein-S-isoprenylcysteine O-methyltransferase Ste14
MQIHRANRLVVTGLYRISRNPMYLGLILALSGWGVVLGSPLALMFVWALARTLVVVQIAPEEEASRDRFGEAYLRYSRRVNRWFGRANQSA